MHVEEDRNRELLLVLYCQNWQYNTFFSYGIISLACFSCVIRKTLLRCRACNNDLGYGLSLKNTDGTSLTNKHHGLASQLKEIVGIYALISIAYAVGI